MISYGYVEDGVITAPVGMPSVFKDVIEWHKLTDAERAEYGWYRCEVENEEFRPRTQERTGPTLSLENGVIYAVYDIRDLTLDEVRYSFTPHLKNLRFWKEVGGVSSMGAWVLTDRESQAQLSSSVTTLASGYVDSIDWKTANGWVKLTFAEVNVIAKDVATHVQKCFSAERSVAEYLEFLTDPLDFEKVDISALFNKAYNGEVIIPVAENPATVEEETPAE